MLPLLASAAITLGAAAAAPAATAAPDLMPAFPESADRQAIARWLVGSAGFPAGAPADIGVQSAVLIVTDSTAGLRQGLHAVSFREEALGVDFVSRTGGRSISGTTTVDCNEGLVRAGAMTVFHGTGLKGERVAAFPAQETWRTPPAGSLYARIVANVCDAEPAVPSAAPAAAPAPAPVPAPESPAAVATTPPEPTAAQPGGVTVQVGAFVTREQATVGLNKAVGLVPGQTAGRSTEIATANVNGAEMYRALIHGFGTRTEAQAFCARLQAQGQPCLVRP